MAKQTEYYDVLKQYGLLSQYFVVGSKPILLAIIKKVNGWNFKKIKKVILN